MSDSPLVRRVMRLVKLMGIIRERWLLCDLTDSEFEDADRAARRRLRALLREMEG